MITSFSEWLDLREGTRATIYTQSSSKGASVDDGQQDETPVIISIDDIVNYEQAGKMQQPKSQENMRNIVTAIKNRQPLPPIIVRRVSNLRGVSNPRWQGRTMVPGGVPNSRYKYQVVDGHHRYWAYKAAGVKQVPAIIIAPENVRRERFWTPE